MFNFNEEPTLNITPLVDVMLVLIAILMLTTPVIIYEEKISLPKGSKKTANKSTKAIEVRVTKNKEIFIKSQKYTFLEFPDSFKVYSSEFSKDTKVIIRADEKLLYRDIMYILKSIKDSQFTKISLLTNG
ncbi:MAG: biopolymer transporter ExbD [Campylobacterales bacterium]|nr:biopolymer transporter ExbD [Campylobacterales bacterium]